MSPALSLILTAAPPALPPATPTDVDVVLRVTPQTENSAALQRTIEQSLIAEGLSVQSATVAADVPALATVGIRLSDDTVHVRIDDSNSDASMERAVPSDGDVTTVVAQETAYMIRSATVSLRDHGTLEESSEAPAAAAPVASAPPDPEPTPPVVSPSPVVAEPDEAPIPAFPRGWYIETQIGPGLYAFGPDRPLPTLDTAVATGFEFGRGGHRDDLRVALALNAAHDERFSVPATWRGGARGPIGLYSQWDVMPQLRIGRTFDRFMPFGSVAVGPGFQTNNDTDRDRVMMSANVAGGAMWQVDASWMQSRLAIGAEVGVRGSIDVLNPTTQNARAYAALKLALYFGQKRK